MIHLSADKFMRRKHLNVLYFIISSVIRIQHSFVSSYIKTYLCTNYDIIFEATKFYLKQWKFVKDNRDKADRNYVLEE